jgi:hypothetical protein
MADPVRVAGTGFGSDGLWVVWSVAEGTRGRRWREARSNDRGMTTSLLLETDTSGRFKHLELSTQTGLLTLHPEEDGTLHGNAVVGGEHSAGVEHVRGIKWRPDGLVTVAGSTICQLAAIHLLGRSLPEFSAVSQPAVAIHPTLVCEPTVVRVERISRDRWRFGGELPIDVDAQGLPLLRDGQIWPVELPD